VFRAAGRRLATPARDAETTRSEGADAPQTPARP
jgi:hypothetical protein